MLTSQLDISTLPFVQQFMLLTPEHKRALQPTLVSQPHDVDKWEIFMSPNFYLEHFNSPLALVRLASHVPKRVSTHGADMSSYMLLAEANHHLWVEEKFKAPFIQEVKRWTTIQPAAHPKIPTYGNMHVPVVKVSGSADMSSCADMSSSWSASSTPSTVTQSSSKAMVKSSL